MDRTNELFTHIPLLTDIRSYLNRSNILWTVAIGSDSDPTAVIVDGTVGARAMIPINSCSGATIHLSIFGTIDLYFVSTKRQLTALFQK